MYQTIYELPSQVRSSLDEADQKVFMEAYNSKAPETEKEVREALKHAWKSCKNLPSSFSFNIIASVDDVDRDGEVIDIESVKDHMDAFIDYGGALQKDHSSYQLGLIWDWNPTKYEGMDAVEVWGNLFGGDLVYDQSRKAFVDGMNNLSIAGEASKGRFQCDMRGCYVKRDVKQLLEISLCVKPANKHCVLKWYNEDAKFTKSISDDVHMDVKQYEIHRSYDFCPTQALCKSLRACGIDAHATYDGVSVEMSKERFDSLVPMWKSLDMVSRYDDGKAILWNRDMTLEKTFKDGYTKGYLDEHGVVTSHITKSQFRDMYDAGILETFNGRYRICRPEPTDW